jgi:hypothetical protein
MTKKKIIQLMKNEVEDFVDIDGYVNCTQMAEWVISEYKIKDEEMVFDAAVEVAEWYEKG